MSRCDWWGLPSDPECCWCRDPLSAHRFVSCESCKGTWFVGVVDGEWLECHACVRGRVANPVFVEQRRAA